MVLAGFPPRESKQAVQIVGERMDVRLG